MAVTKDDVRDFSRFADERVSRGEATSIKELAGEWEAMRREHDDTIADIRQSHADIDAGSVEPLADAFADVRKRLDRR